MDATYIWVLSGVLVTLELFGAFSATVGDINNAFKTPCGRPVTFMKVNENTGDETISLLQIIVNEAKSLAESSKFELIQAIGSSGMLRVLDSWKFFNIINAEYIQAGINSKNDIGTCFKSNFGNVSELAIYTNLAASDEATEHMYINAVLEKLLNILCWLQIGTFSQGESITQYLNTSIISNQVPLFTSRVEIIYRNYIIMRDVEKNLEKLSLLY